jgi:cytochrome c551/c552
MKHFWRVSLALGCAAAFTGAQADALQALDQGCLSCHGHPARADAPPYSQLAKRFERYRGDTGAAARIASELRQTPWVGGIGLHERVSEDSARAVIQWVIDGAAGAP